MDKVRNLPLPMGYSGLQLGPRAALQKVRRQQRENTSLSQPTINRNRNPNQRESSMATQKVIKKQKKGARNMWFFVIPRDENMLTYVSNMTEASQQ